MEFSQKSLWNTSENPAKNLPDDGDFFKSLFMEIIRKFLCNCLEILLIFLQKSFLYSYRFIAIDFIVSAWDNFVYPELFRKFLRDSLEFFSKIFWEKKLCDSSGNS